VKKTAYLLPSFLLVLILILSACGGNTVPTVESASNTDSNDDAAPVAAQEEPAVPAGDPAAGKVLFAGTCSACHGPEGEGVPGLGKDMTASTFIASQSDAELIDFIKQGRDPSHPLNTTGVAMPPKGGNPTLTDENLSDIVAFIRSIHQ
jgi:disulfide bond formation protein DsbB